MENTYHNKTNETNLKRSLFNINNSKVNFRSKQQELNFDLNLISNVRLIKDRVFYINIFFTVIGIITYFGCSFLFKISPSPYYFPFVLISILYCSFAYKQFSYKLLIINKHLNFHILNITKKNIADAQYFLSFFNEEKLKN